MSKDCALGRALGFIIALPFNLVVEFEERNLLEIIRINKLGDAGKVLVTHIQEVVLDSHFIPNVQFSLVALEKLG